MCIEYNRNLQMLIIYYTKPNTNWSQRKQKIDIDQLW